MLVTWMDVVPIDHAVVLSSSPGLSRIGGLSDLSVVVQPFLRHLSHQQGRPADRLLGNQQTFTNQMISLDVGFKIRYLTL